MWSITLQLKERDELLGSINVDWIHLPVPGDRVVVNGVLYRVKSRTFRPDDKWVMINAYQI